MVDYFMARTKIAYSFGIANDVTWDIDMVKKGYDIYMYDPTIDSLPYENQKFHFDKIGIATCISDGDKYDTLSNIIRKNNHGHNDGMILKMDVEGAEWGGIMMTESDILDRFDQMVFELHGLLDINNRDIIIAVLEKIGKTHGVVHVHANNHSDLLWIMGQPYADVLEVTFVNNRLLDKEQNDVKLPNTYDAPNDPAWPEIILGEWNNRAIK